jgi:2-oxo-4-hydroxy-4-carboxy-5-ureidoimidazoline decarboxylase
MTIADFDHLPQNEKEELLKMCCGSTAWIKKMISILPVNDLVDLLEYAEEEWYDCNPADWLEAFQSHIKIGDIESLKNNKAKNADWPLNEQAGVLNSPPDLLDELARANEMYEENFGYNYIVVASGKSASEMIENLLKRLDNDPRDELMIAAAEQNKITQMRLQKLFS